MDQSENENQWKDAMRMTKGSNDNIAGDRDRRLCNKIDFEFFLQQITILARKEGELSKATSCIATAF